MITMSLEAVRLDVPRQVMRICGDSLRRSAVDGRFLAGGEPELALRALADPMEAPSIP